MYLHLYYVITNLHKEFNTYTLYIIYFYYFGAFLSQNVSVPLIYVCCGHLRWCHQFYHMHRLLYFLSRCRFKNKLRSDYQELRHSFSATKLSSPPVLCFLCTVVLFLVHMTALTSDIFGANPALFQTKMPA